MSTQKITPFLWFDGNAEEAVEHYVGVFGARVTRTAKMGGKPLTVAFEIGGLEIVALNGGPMYKPTPASSLLVNCDSQEEIDAIWKKILAHGGTESQCGWITDKYGFSWQIVPSRLGELMSDPDPAKAGRTAQAMMKMVKLDIAELERAHAGR